MKKAAKEFRNFTVEEIKSRLDELRKELMKEYIHISAGTAPSNPGRVRKNRKSLACLLTILRQKEVKQKEVKMP